MKTSNTLILTLIALVLICAQPMPGATIIYTGSVVPATTDFTGKPITVQGFNPSLGSLTSVSVVFGGTGQMTQRFENQNGPGSIGFQQSLTQVLRMPDNSTVLFSLNQQENHIYSVAASDGVFDFGGASGGTYGYTVDLSGGQTLSAPGDLNQFLTAGNIAFYLSATAVSSSSDTTGNSARGASTTAGGTVGVTYTFIPVPEPGAATLLCLAGLLAFCRKWH